MNEMLTWGFKDRDGVIGEYADWYATYAEAYDRAVELAGEYRCSVTFYPLGDPYDTETVYWDHDF